MQASPSNKKIILKVLQYVLFLGLAVFLLYIAFKNVSWSDLWEGIRTADYWWIGASLLAGFMAFLVRARRWQLIIEPLGYKPSFKHTYDAVMITYLANFAMPRFGELARCGALRKTEKIPFDSLLGTVVLERIFDTLCLLIIAVAVFFLRINTFGEFMTTNLWQPILSRTEGHVGMLLVLAAGCIVLPALLIWVFRKRLAQMHFVRKIGNSLRGLAAGLKSGFRLQRRGTFFFYSFLLWLLYWLQGYTTMLAIPETASLNGIDALFLLVVGSLAMIVPVQGGLGAYHLLISMALLALYNIPQTQGVVFATISHETQAIMMIVLGFVALLSVLMGGKKKNRKAGSLD